MQASKISVDQMAAPNQLGWWHDYAWVNKFPFAVVFGCILALSSPGYDQWWLAWFGLAPLLVLISLCRSRNEALLCGLGFGMGYHLVSLSWYLSLYPITWMGVDNWLGMQAVSIVWILESAHESLLTVGFAWMIYSLPMRPGYLGCFERPYFPRLLSVPLIWVFFQWFLGQLEAFLGIPTNQIAYSQYGQTALIQVAKLAGPGCVDFLIILVNAAIAACLLELPTGGQRAVERVDLLSTRLGALIDLIIAMLLVASAVTWGNFELKQIEDKLAYQSNLVDNKSLPKLPLAVLQNNITIEQEHMQTASAAEIAQLYMDLSSNLGVGLLILPEGVINASQTTPGFLLPSLQGRALSEKKEVLAGFIESYGGSWLNAARIIAPDQTDRGFYVKRRLFPLLEFIPWQNLSLSLPDAIIKNIPAVKESFLRTKKTQVLSSVWGKIGLSISTEIVYPHLIASEVEEGASLLVNIADLSYFRKSALSRQILACAVFRAVENERYLVLASNTGVSAVIDPAGVINSVTLPGRRGTLVDTVQFLCDKTMFSRMWWL